MKHYHHFLFQRADVAAAPFLVTGSRRKNEILDFTRPFLHSTFAILLKSDNDDDNGIYLMEDLLNQTTYQLGVIKGSRAEKILKKSKSPIYQAIWQRIIKSQTDDSNRRRHSRSRSKDNVLSNIIPTLALGVARVRQSNLALIMESTASTNLCSK
jgi:hypothetical protein